MDEIIRAIVAALLAGATCRMQDIGSDAVSLAYDQLKRLVSALLGRRTEVDALETSPPLPETPERLGTSLSATGADLRELHRLAAELLAVIERLPEAAKAGITTANVWKEAGPRTDVAAASLSTDVDDRSGEVSDTTRAIYQAQIRRDQRVQWRPLPVVNYPAFSDNDAIRKGFIRDLAMACRQAFGPASVSFTALIKTCTVLTGDEQEAKFYFTVCPHSALVEALFRRARRQMDMLMDYGSLPPPAKEKLTKKELASWETEEEGLLQNWSVDWNVTFEHRFFGLRVLYDTAAKSIRLSGCKEYSLEPAAFPLHLTTTSELLEFIAALDHVDCAFLGDAEWFLHDTRKMKLLMQLLEDKCLDLGAIRLDMADGENWNFLNPAFDAEMGPAGFKGAQPH